MLWWNLAPVGYGGYCDGVQALGNLCFVHIEDDEKWTMCGGHGISQSCRPGLINSTLILSTLCIQPMLHHGPRGMIFHTPVNTHMYMD